MVYHKSKNIINYSSAICNSGHMFCYQLDHKGMSDRCAVCNDRISQRIQMFLDGNPILNMLKNNKSCLHNSGSASSDDDDSEPFVGYVHPYQTQLHQMNTTASRTNRDILHRARASKDLSRISKTIEYEITRTDDFIVGNDEDVKILWQNPNYLSPSTLRKTDLITTSAGAKEPAEMPPRKRTFRNVSTELTQSIATDSQHNSSSPKMEIESKPSNADESDVSNKFIFKCFTQFISTENTSGMPKPQNNDDIMKFFEFQEVATLEELEKTKEQKAVAKSACENAKSTSRDRMPLRYDPRKYEIKRTSNDLRVDEAEWPQYESSECSHTSFRMEDPRYSDESPPPPQLRLNKSNIEKSSPPPHTYPFKIMENSNSFMEQSPPADAVLKSQFGQRKAPSYDRTFGERSRSVFSHRGSGDAKECTEPKEQSSQRSMHQETIVEEEVKDITGYPRYPTRGDLLKPRLQNDTTEDSTSQHSQNNTIFYPKPKSISKQSVSAGASASNNLERNLEVEHTSSQVLLSPAPSLHDVQGKAAEDSIPAPVPKRRSTKLLTSISAAERSEALQESSSDTSISFKLEANEAKPKDIPIANKIKIPRNPIYCPLSCEKPFFITAYCEHIERDHLEVPIAHAKPAEVVSIYFDPPNEKTFTNKCLMLCMVSDKLLDLGSTKFKDSLPVMVMAKRLRTPEDQASEYALISQAHQPLLIWVIGLVLPTDTYFKLSIGAKSKAAVQKRTTMRGLVSSFRDFYDPDVNVISPSLLIVKKDEDLYTQGGTQSINLQLSVL